MSANKLKPGRHRESCSTPRDEMVSCSTFNRGFVGSNPSEGTDVLMYTPLYPLEFLKIAIRTSEVDDIIQEASSVSPRADCHPHTGLFFNDKVTNAIC